MLLVSSVEMVLLSSVQDDASMVKLNNVIEIVFFIVVNFDLGGI